MTKMYFMTSLIRLLHYSDHIKYHMEETFGGNFAKFDESPILFVNSTTRSICKVFLTYGRSQT